MDVDTTILSALLSWKGRFIEHIQIGTVQSAGSYTLGLNTVAPAAQAALAGGSGTVQGLYDALLSTMKSGGTLGGSGRFAKLAPVIRSSFDVDLPGVTGIYLDQSEIRA